MLRIFHIGFAIAACFFFATCGGNRTAPVATTPPNLPLTVAALLPAPPADRQTSAGEVLQLSGGAFVPTMTTVRVALEHNEAVFSPTLIAPGPQGVAACVYSFNLGAYAGAAELRFDWGTPEPPAGSYWVGLARPASQTWQWFAQPAAGIGGVLALASFAPYRYADGGLLVGIAVTGSAQLRLYGLRVGPPSPPPDVLPLEDIVLPAGFSISLYAYPVPNARAMCLSDGGVLYVGSRAAGNVYACRDLDGDRIAEDIRIVASGFSEPVGVTMQDNDLYFSSISRVYRLDDIDANLAAPPAAQLAVDGLPTETHHGWKFIAFGPDGKLYVPVGAPCNICDSADYNSPLLGMVPYASILRMDPDGGNLEVVARGVRNTVGFDWQPGTDELWFTDNGRDNMGDDVPPCELNEVAVGSGTGAGAPHYGYPYFHGNSIADPGFGAGHDPADYREPVQELGPHVAPLGMRFYRGSMFPAEYRGQVFIAEHGSWNRSVPIGARVTLVPGGASSSYTIFAEGWQDATGARWGRPVDVLELPDGSLLVSDDDAGAVYRITYQ